jgi:uncharacterized phiE125 gp8 family phage protein
MSIHRTSAVVTPATPIFDVAAGKLRAGLDWLAGDARDALMAGFIAAATAKVQHDTGVALGEQTHDVFFDALPSGWSTLPWRPVTSLVSVGAIDAAGVVTPLDVGAFVLDGSSETPQPARIFSAALDRVVCRIVCGWDDNADIPPLLVHAVGLLTAHYATAGRDLVQVGTIVATMPLGYDELIAPFQLVTLA